MTVPCPLDVHDISLSPFIVPSLECFSLCVRSECENTRYSRRCTYVLLRTSMESTGTRVHSQARSLHRSHMRASPRPCSDAQSCTPHAPPRRRSHAPLPPRVHEILDHQRHRLRFRWSRSMMSSQSAREHTQAVSGMRRGRQLAEAIAWVRGGGADLMAGAGHVAAGSVPPRRRPRLCQPACSAMAHSRHGLGHRPFGPAQIMRRPRRLSLRHRGRRKPEHGS